MHVIRPVFAPHPKSFGRGPARDHGERAQPAGALDDIKLFAMTFVAGFLFVSVLIG